MIPTAAKFHVLAVIEKARTIYVLISWGSSFALVASNLYAYCDQEIKCASKITGLFLLTLPNLGVCVFLGKLTIVSLWCHIVWTIAVYFNMTWNVLLVGIMKYKAVQCAHSCTMWNWRKNEMYYNSAVVSISHQ